MKGSTGSGPIPARWLPERTEIGRGHRESKAAATARWRSRPRSGLIGKDPDQFRTPSHEERDWAGLAGRSWNSTPTRTELETSRRLPASSHWRKDLEIRRYHAARPTCCRRRQSATEGCLSERPTHPETAEVQRRLYGIVSQLRHLLQGCNLV